MGKYKRRRAPRPPPALVEGLLATAQRFGLAPFDASGRLVAGYLRRLSQILDSAEPEPET